MGSAPWHHCHSRKLVRTLPMDIDEFMLSYKRAWETSDEHLLASLFAPDGVYRNTPFAEQRGHDAIKAYWQRTKLQEDIRLELSLIHI